MHLNPFVSSPTNFHTFGFVCHIVWPYDLDFVRQGWPQYDARQVSCTNSVQVVYKYNRLLANGVLEGFVKKGD